MDRFFFPPIFFRRGTAAGTSGGHSFPLLRGREAILPVPDADNAHLAGHSSHRVQSEQRLLHQRMAEYQVRLAQLLRRRPDEEGIPQYLLLAARGLSRRHGQLAAARLQSGCDKGFIKSHNESYAPTCLISFMLHYYLNYQPINRVTSHHSRAPDVENKKILCTYFQISETFETIKDWFLCHCSLVILSWLFAFILRSLRSGQGFLKFLPVLLVISAIVLLQFKTVEFSSFVQDSWDSLWFFLRILCTSHFVLLCDSFKSGRCRPTSGA